MKLDQVSVNHQEFSYEGFPSTEQILLTTFDQVQQLQDSRAMSYAAGVLGQIYEWQQRYPQAK